jgi:hypothetical protein
MQLTPDDWKRNTVSFAYPSFFFNRQNRPQNLILHSTLKGFNPISHDCSEREMHHDYENVGQFSFQSALLPGVKHPTPDFPSMKWLSIIDLAPIEKYINKVKFSQLLAVVPQCSEDLNGGDFEDWIYNYAENRGMDMFVKFPQQVECMPMSFEDPFSRYEVNMDQNGGLSIRKLRQEKTPDQFRIYANQISHRQQDQGLYCQELNTLATVMLLNGTEYDEYNNAVYKMWSEETLTVPFSCVMRKRAASHYLNVNDRVNTEHGRLKADRPAICFNQGLMGVVARVKSKDTKKMTIKIEIDKEVEESKIHNPFLAENFLRRELLDQGVINEKGKTDKLKASGNKNYYGDQEIEQMLDLERGTVNKVTGSYLIAYDSPEHEDRQVVDIGLNMKNFTKKVHIADYVRFINQDGAANTIYDDFNHNQHSRGSQHIRKHWEYSQECVDIIQKYCEKFPEAIEAIGETSRSKKSSAMHSLHDLYPELDPKKEKMKAVSQLKELLSWVEQLPISKMPYVEMGFDALDISLVQKLQDHSTHIKNFYTTIDLKAQKLEVLDSYNVYQEQFPFWAGPY